MRSLIPCLACFALLGCAASEAPLPSDISGTWLATAVESGTTLHLTQSGTAITGMGTWFRFINPPTGTLTVTGTYIRPHAVLTLQYDNGLTTQFTAAVTDASHLAGVEVFPAGATDSLTFVRQ